jgi:hypothetical protein
LRKGFGFGFSNGEGEMRLLHFFVWGDG